MSTQKHIKSDIHARWSAYIEKFSYKFVYKVGQHNKVVDALSQYVALMRTLSMTLQESADLATKRICHKIATEFRL